MGIYPLIQVSFKDMVNHKHKQRGDNVKYQILGNTGVRVSSVALGTANFGMRWGYGASLDESRAILDAFAEDGGNYDTADVYQFGESEEFLGALLQGRRENFFLATKYSSGASKAAGGLVTTAVAGRWCLQWGESGNGFDRSYGYTGFIILTILRRQKNWYRGLKILSEPENSFTPVCPIFGLAAGTRSNGLPGAVSRGADCRLSVPVWFHVSPNVTC